MHTKVASQMEMALRLFLKNNPDVAWTALLEALAAEGFSELTPDDLSGIAINHGGDSQRKLFSSRLMVELIPQSGEAHCFLGHAYRDNHRHVEALRSYDRAIECDMGSMKNVHTKHDIVTYRLYKAEVLIEMRQYGEAFVELLLAQKMLLSTDSPLEHLVARIKEGFEICIPRVVR